MSHVRPRAALAAALLAATLGGLALADEPARAFGKLRNADPASGSLEISTRQGLMKIMVGEAAIFVAKAVPPAECPVATVHVLGRVQPETRDPNSGQTLPEQIVNVVAIVAAERFDPPPLAAELAAKKLQWISGPIHAEGSQVEVAGKGVQMGKDRKILAIVPGTKQDLAKGRIVIVDGTRPSPTSKQMALEKVTIVMPDAPGQDVKVAFGL
jgi:hypothetical protein